MISALKAMDVVQKGRNFRDLRVLTAEQMGGMSGEKYSHAQLERDKRARREIANCNERRRMQSINSGFQRIKSLLPRCNDEKMSKSAILHQAVEYINRLEQEKLTISRQNEELVKMLKTFKRKTLALPPTKKRKEDDDDVAAPSIVPPSPDSSNDYGQKNTVLTHMQNLVDRLKEQLCYERQCREAVEKQIGAQKSSFKMERLVEVSVEEQVVLSPDPELSSIFNLPMFLAEHEANLLYDSSEFRDRSVMAQCNLETIIKAIHHVERGDRLAKSMQEYGTAGDERSQQTERTLRFHIPLSSSCQPLPSVPDDGRSSESDGQIPVTLNAVSVLVSPQCH